MKVRRIVSLLASIVLLSGCGLHGHGKVDRKDARATHANGASVSSHPGEVVAPGIVEPWGGEVALSPRESGWIARVLVSEGQTVAAGDLLATLEDGAERAALESANADLAEAEAIFKRTEHGPTVFEVNQARAEAKAAAARAAIARTELDRTKKLGEAGVASLAEVDRANSNADVQASLANASGARLAALVSGSRAEDRAAAKARVESARARKKIAEANLERRRVVAPSASSVLLSRFHVGEFFTVGPTPLFVLGDTSRLQIRLEVDEIDASRVAASAGCTVYGDDGARLLDGVVIRLAPRMGRRGLAIESPTARADVRVREIFVEVAGGGALVPGQRVWGHLAPRPIREG